MKRRTVVSYGRPWGQPEGGQALVEFALVLPILVFLVMALFDFGRVVYAQHTITLDSREAVRVAIVSPSLTQAKYDAIRAAALRMSPGTPLAAANITGETGTCTSVSDATSPATCLYPDGVASGNRAVVKISVAVPIITPIISTVVGGSFTVSAQSIAYLP